MVQALKLKMKEQKGFTLIELLAVIVILGIIAAIAIPAISNVINKSDKKASAQEGISIINAAKMYVAEHPGDADTLAKSASPYLEGTNAATADDIDEYLDHVKDNTFKVKITRDGTAGKFSYSLLEHEANTKLEQAELSEQDLINKAQ